MALKINQIAWVAPCKTEKTLRVSFLSNYSKEDGTKVNEAPYTIFARVSEKIDTKNLNLPEKGKFMKVRLLLSDYKKENSDEYQTSAFLYSLKAVDKKEKKESESSDAPF